MVCVCFFPENNSDVIWIEVNTEIKWTISTKMIHCYKTQRQVRRQFTGPEFDPSMEFFLNGMEIRWI